MKLFICWLGVLIAGTIIIVSSCKKEEKIKVPIIETLSIGDITDSSATSGGNITDDGGLTVTSRGVCWSEDTKPTIKDNITVNGAGVGTFPSTIKGLSGGTTYYVKAYATNSAGTGYGMAMSFKTLGEAPIAETKDATNVLTHSATLNGTINSNYLSTIVTFEYGLTETYGQTATASQSPVKGNTDVDVSVDLTGLTPGATYHFRVKTLNDLGIDYGADSTFTTLGKVPTASTYSISNLRFDGVRLNGEVKPNYLETNVTFEYGTTTSYGQTIFASPYVVTGNASFPVSVNLTGLSLNTTYYFRVKAANELGVTYGDQMTFTIWMNSPGQQITDVDGNIYSTVKIGTQTWMAENLETTHYRDGTAIPYITDNTEWMASISGAYCWPNNTPESKNIWGAFYNWFTVIDNHSLCPAGWHIPSTTEFAILENFLGGASIAGGKMKTPGTLEEGNGIWKSPNAGADNSSGFTAIPAGYRNYDGNFYGQAGHSAGWWTSVSKDSRDARSRGMFYNGMDLQDSYYWKTSGGSIRCVKD